MLESMLAQALETCAEQDCVFICKEPDFVREVVKSKKLNITLMSYDQALKVTQFNKPVMFDSYRDFVKYTFPVFNIKDWSLKTYVSK